LKKFDAGSAKIAKEVYLLGPSLQIHDIMHQGRLFQHSLASSEIEFAPLLLLSIAWPRGTVLVVIRAGIE
jgi:hypothetical protein